MITIQAPYKYIQGPGLVDELGKHVEHLGKKFLILGSKTIMKKKQESVEKSFKEAGLECTFDRFGGEITVAEYKRISDMVKDDSYDAIIGLGGGKTIDTAKAAANMAEVPFISVPSTASNDAPTSSLSVIYNDEGHVEAVEMYKTNPALVVVDSAVIADAPVNTLVAGMGDALATYFEAEVCYEHGYTNTLGSDVSNTAMAIGELCYDLLLANGMLAKASVEKKLVSKALENTIEANTYLSGMGFENGGLAAAHAIQDALTTIPECHDNTMHGDRVAFGTICLLMLQERWDEAYDVIDFCVSVGLPVTFKELSITENIEENIEGILDTAYAEDMDVYFMPPNTTKDDLYSTMLLADEVGQRFTA